MGCLVARSMPAVVLAVLLAVGCDDDDVEGDDDAGTNADADTDADADSDADADADTGTDTCPEQDYQVINVGTGYFHTCAVLESGGLKCWGSNQFGGLGYPIDEQVCGGSTPDTCPFVELGGPAVQVSLGRYHTCALLEDGEIECWGGPGAAGPWSCWDSHGYIDYLDEPAVQISTSDRHNSALLASGDVFVWGCMNDGVSNEQFPQPDFAGSAIQTATGASHQCVLLDGGDVYCWGFNYQGQLGYGHTDFVAAAQVPDQVGPVELGGPAVQVAAGGDHTCAILEGGDVVCWGWGFWGQLGYGNSENVGDDELPADVGAVDLGGQAASISAGMQHTCAVLDDGALRCWGCGGDGSLGTADDENVGDDELPADVSPISVGGPVTQVAAGMAHTCVILEAGTIRCWGRNDSQLGYGDILGGEEYIGDDEVPASLCEVPVM